MDNKPLQPKLPHKNLLPDQAPRRDQQRKLLLEREELPPRKVNEMIEEQTLY
jgi:hypothetical protein